MGREIVYCEGCGVSLRTDDFEKGRAHEVNQRPWCVACKPLPAPPPAKKTSTGRIPTFRPSSSTTARAVSPGTTRRAASSGPSFIAIAGIAAAVALLLVLLALAFSSGRPSHRSPAPEPPPAPPRPSPPRSPSSSRPPPAPPPREEAPLVAVDPALQLDTYLGQIRELVAKDPRFFRRPDTLSLIAATLKVAGARTAEVEKIRTDYEKAFDDAGARAAAGLRAEAEKLAAAGDAETAAAALDKLPTPFAETRHAQALRALREEIVRKAEEADRARRQRREAELRAWKQANSGGESHFEVVPEYRGRGPALVTHPVSREQPSGLEREIDVPAGKKTSLVFQVAPHAQGDWELRVLVEGKERLRQPVGPPGADWREVKVDLSDAAGRRVKVRLENAPTQWSWEFGHWADFELRGE